VGKEFDTTGCADGRYSLVGLEGAVRGGRLGNERSIEGVGKELDTIGRGRGDGRYSPVGLEGAVRGG
jgi:hypothetical protein